MVPAVQHLYVVFSCFLIFVMISLIGNTIVRVLWHSMDRKPLQFPLIVHYLYMSCGASTKTIHGFWRLWSMGFKLLEKHNFISLSNAPIFIYKRCRTRPGKRIDEEGHQFHVSADTCTCKPVVKKISAQDHTPCQWVFGTTFTGTTFLETSARNLVW